MIIHRFDKLSRRYPRMFCKKALTLTLRAFITEHYYTCTPEILRSLGEMYAAGGSMTENIDHAGGKGTASFARQAIAAYCRSL